MRSTVDRLQFMERSNTEVDAFLIAQVIFWS